MQRIKIDIDPEDVLGELDINDVINFYGHEAVIGELTGSLIVEHWDNDDLLDELDNDKIEEYAKNIQEARG